MKNLDFDNDLNRLRIERKELIAKIPLLHKKEVIDTSIKQYCESAKVRFEKCDDFETKRQFLLDHIKKVVYWDEEIELHGSVPVKLKVYEGKEQDIEMAKIEFCIKGNLKRIGGTKFARAPYASIETLKRKEYDRLMEATRH